jgi:MFS family permease
LQVLTLLVLTGVDIPALSTPDQQEPGRSLLQIVRQPIFLVAVLGSMVGYGVMVLLMTATPLAMVAIHYPFHSIAAVLRWHILGMFAPSFFTGFLIARFGVLTIILWGVGLNLSCIAINWLGTEIEQFLAALTLLGIGWNFLFVGSTTLLTQAYTPAEKAKAQAMHDFLMFSCVAIATFLSGQLFSRFGWVVMNAAAIPGLGLVLMAVLWLRRQQSQQQLMDTSWNPIKK